MEILQIREADRLPPPIKTLKCSFAGGALTARLSLYVARDFKECFTELYSTASRITLHKSFYG
jgi:hypothetical protein